MDFSLINHSVQSPFTIIIKNKTQNNLIFLFDNIEFLEINVKTKKEKFYFRAKF